MVARQKGRIYLHNCTHRYQSLSSHATYYNGAVYTGVAGGDRSARGKVTALDAKTGKEMWHFWTVPDPGTRGSETWPSPNEPNPARAAAYVHSGSNVWQMRRSIPISA